MGKIRAAAYCRVSTDQELQDLSFESQCNYYRQLIESDPAMELVGIYGDHGKSGMHIDGRPEFQRMIEDCKAGKIDLIYSKSVSRFARNLSDLLKTLRELKDMNVSVVFEKEGLDTRSAASELMLGILGTIAQEESHSLATNMHWGREERLKKGQPYGAVSYGYRDRGKEHTWVTVPTEAAQVRLAFRLASEGTPYPEIRKQLMKLQKELGGDRRWSQYNLHYLLTNPYYTGDYMNNKTTVIIRDNKPVRVENDGLADQYYIEEHHEALVSHEDFDFVQDLIKRGMLNAKRRNYSDEEKKLLEECQRRREQHERSDENTGQKNNEVRA